MVATAIIGAGVAGAGATAYSSNKAAKAQTNAAGQATDQQRQMFDISQQNLAPFVGTGTGASNYIGNNLNKLIAPVNMSESQLKTTPGYQFNLTQGLKGVQNGAAARGLGSSGAALKGAATYATGLADSTYQNQFNNSVTNAQNTYNRLTGISTIGANAAAQVGTNAVQTGSNIGNNLTGAGNAQAASYLNAGQGYGNAANSIPNSLITNQYLQNMKNSGGIYNPDHASL